jgi:hypothetical protein
LPPYYFLWVKTYPFSLARSHAITNGQPLSTSTKTSYVKGKILDRHSTSTISSIFLSFILAHLSKDGKFVKKSSLGHWVKNVALPAAIANSE